MEYKSNYYISLTALIALVVTGLGATFSYWVLDPSVGIDDANITQVYARNIAEGHGYVYNIGGERVEGSTSLLWTLINAAVFRVSVAPERLLTGLCAAMTSVTIFSAMQIARGLSPNKELAAAWATGVAFLAFPGAFGWMVWSLMDITLWIMLIALTILMLHWIEAVESQAGLLLGLAILAALLPVTRPEGIALTTALAGFYILRRLVFGIPGLLVGLIIGLAGATAAATVTAWRLIYFGYPFPNTFYAKTSADFVAQLELGVRYLLSYLQEPQNILLVVTFCFAGALIMALGRTAQRMMLWLTLYLILGGVGVYTVLGGDHFGSHRQFIYFLPLALPVAVVGLIELVGALQRDGKAPWLVITLLLAPALLVGLTSAARFVQTKGDMAIEFAIADAGRELGEKLNALPGDPSIGVFAAGAIRMAYDRQVQDLLGLNWTEMAHAPDDGHRSDVPNQHGFNSDVFWNNPPDVFPVFPSDGRCPTEWVPLSGYLDAASDRISQTDRFRQNYELYCDAGDAFYAARDYVAREWDMETETSYGLNP